MAISADLDTLLEVVSAAILAMATIIIGYVLGYVAGQAVREAMSGMRRDRPTRLYGLRPSVIAGKITKASVFAIMTIVAIRTMAEGGEFLGLSFLWGRSLLGVIMVFIGAFMSDLASVALAGWVRGGACLPEDTDPTRELIFLGLMIAVVLAGLGVLLLESLLALIIYSSLLVGAVVSTLLASRRRMCRGV